MNKTILTVAMLEDFGTSNFTIYDAEKGSFHWGHDGYWWDGDSQYGYTEEAIRACPVVRFFPCGKALDIKIDATALTPAVTRNDVYEE